MQLLIRYRSCYRCSTEPLTSENAALVLIDHQVGLMPRVRGHSTGELKHNVVALAKAAKALNLPNGVTTTARDSMWGPTFPELVEALRGVPIIDRSSVNAFDDPKVAQAITETGRKRLIFAVFRGKRHSSTAASVVIEDRSAGSAVQTLPNSSICPAPSNHEGAVLLRRAGVHVAAPV
jgi:Isochorismatase family